MSMLMTHFFLTAFVPFIYKYINRQLSQALGGLIQFRVAAKHWIHLHTSA